MALSGQIKDTPRVSSGDDTFSRFVTDQLNWNIQYILSEFAPIMGFLLIFCVTIIGRFYSTCFNCNLINIVLLASYGFIVSHYLIQSTFLADECGRIVPVRLLTLFSILPTLIFVITATVPLWTGLEYYFGTYYGAQLPVNIMTQLLSVFLAMFIFRTCIYVSGHFLKKRICIDDKFRNFWTLYL